MASAAEREFGGQICLGMRKKVKGDMRKTIKSDTTRERPDVCVTRSVELSAEFRDEMRVDGFKD